MFCAQLHSFDIIRHFQWFLSTQVLWAHIVFLHRWQCNAAQRFCDWIFSLISSPVSNLQLTSLRVFMSLLQIHVNLCQRWLYTMYLLAKKHENPLKQCHFNPNSNSVGLNRSHTLFEKSMPRSYRCWGLAWILQKNIAGLAVMFQRGLWCIIPRKHKEP